MKALLVDGYNLIYSHPDLSGLVEGDPDAAREGLVRELAPLAVPDRYALVMVVFDAAGSSQAEPVVEDRKGMTVVFTRRRQSADSFIETAVRQLVRDYEVTVATSDRTLLNLVRGFGAGGMRGEILFATVEDATQETRREIDRSAGSRRTPLEDRVSDEVRRLLDEMRYRD